MKATVIRVTQNVQKTSNAGKPYTVTEFEYQGEPYQGKTKPPVTRNVFSNDPVNQILQTLKPGDSVELGFTQNGKYKNLSSVEKIDGPSPVANPTAPNMTGGSYQKNDDETALRIARSVALKAAADVVNGVAGIAFETVHTEIIGLARHFEKYLTLDDSDPDDFKQETFEDSIEANSKDDVTL